MATIKQQKLAKIVLDNPNLMKDGNKGKLLEQVSYSKGIQKQPSRVLESKGFREELAKFGLTEKLITTALVEDITKKPQNRLGEMRLGAEILQMNDNPQGGNKTLILVVSGESASRYNVQPN